MTSFTDSCMIDSQKKFLFVWTLLRCREWPRASGNRVWPKSKGNCPRNRLKVEDHDLCRCVTLTLGSMSHRIRIELVELGGRVWVPRRIPDVGRRGKRQKIIMLDHSVTWNNAWFVRERT